MKLLLLLFLLTHSFLLQAQYKNNDSASFVTKINIKQATKDGIYLNEYVVNIPYKMLLKLNGKKVRITGKVKIVKGLNNYVGGEIRQGREDDTKHILKPKIEIIGD